MNNLQDSIAVITGAGRGLGAALAISLADAGCKVVLCGRNEAALAHVAATIETRTGQLPTTVQVDLADSASVTRATQTISQRFPTLDVLINNGAMWLEANEQGYSPEDVQGVINAAVTGTFLFTQGLLASLRRSRRPDIVTHRFDQRIAQCRLAQRLSAVLRRQARPAGAGRRVASTAGGYADPFVVRAPAVPGRYLPDRTCLGGRQRAPEG
ncbi:SDR family NAD(P)-dependent oxidoreductase [Pseudomonas donghuensis]|uniref:SDR family NAD(P)-dependent oxidoreductase n=1 Tax=Pseudomonas donghuensis TaxID=1163398 RepID=UPI0004A02BA8|nr:SDR family NAD(P)-dependent oxidoreductase [Pseudomonas donghuensis]MCP6694026.1 SDR family NAD(P)-dependent oxidoreductase [Pseudomonas donghuensis]MDF9894599.1 NAD(P)-dependent dehydrogenase (short-subunit alcohol dehydrogenase family) [Pseudomonas vranovensis]